MDKDLENIAEHVIKVLEDDSKLREEVEEKARMFSLCLGISTEECARILFEIRKAS